MKRRTPLSSSPSSQPSPHTKDDSKCLPSSIIIDLIYGNDAETQVFAHAHDTNSSSSLTFRITQDAARPPQNFANRIVARFHDLSVSSSGETFPDRESMRKALGDAIRRAWSGCVYAAAIPYAVVDLYVGDVEEIELEEADVKWRMRHETVLYQQYLDALLPVDDFFPSKHDTSEQAIKHIDIEEAAIEFADLLHSQSEFIFNRDSFYNSVKVTSTMAPHPNIQPNPQMVLTSNTEVKSCSLYPFKAQGTLDTQVTAAQEQAKTYHMDIKPANFLIDDHGNAILIDWEQSGAPLYTLAPEANGEWDVAEVTDGDVQSERTFREVDQLGTSSQNGVGDGQKLAR
ncbi:hypothetical protein M440DRAFT_1464871 [Trichoderma longibrachiatum ATCC 18648]|uniref:Protein kinase domain-containing protein n=1 Tax=Trichoderma longibrachiatum ATCC 18648 TaxID=983965 RepID=A0A2T4BVS4_TRILO|nr:hypothetical protein M440DRAFT_1464871 [Trichoderma longibrachiatum ATCC 18648]